MEASAVVIGIADGFVAGGFRRVRQCNLAAAAAIPQIRSRMALHLTKVAFGVRDVDHLGERLRARADAGALFLTTRYLPRRHVEISGTGSLFWILKHQLIARSTVNAFGTADDGRVAIHLDPVLWLVERRARRAHQGWRYLDAEDAPPDLLDCGDQGEAMPATLAGRLLALGLI